MTVGSHNIVKFTVKKSSCQKHCGYVFASGKNALYPWALYQKSKLIYRTELTLDKSFYLIWFPYFINDFHYFYCEQFINLTDVFFS